MEESTLRWPTVKEREEMEEVCSIGEVPHTLELELGLGLGILITLPHIIFLPPL